MEVEKKKKKMKLVLLIAVPVMVILISQRLWMPSLDFNQVWGTVSQHGTHLSLQVLLLLVSVCFA